MEELFRKERYIGINNVYTPFTRIGNWSEDVCKDEEELYKLLLKEREGNLRLQKIKPLINTALRPVELTQNLDGYLHDGDVVMLKFVGGDFGLPSYLSAIPALPLPFDPDDGIFKSPCAVAATSKPLPVGRSVFIVHREDRRVSNHFPIMYGESIAIYTVPFVGSLKLSSETKNALKFARGSKHQEVELVDECSAHTAWKIVFRNSQFRMEMEGTPVTVNTDLNITHAFTNRNLAVEKDHIIRSIFGVDTEVSTHNYYGVYKSDEAQNVWQFATPPADPNRFDVAVQLPAQQRVNPNFYSDVIPPLMKESMPGKIAV